jgi:uncharacterized protein (TIGR03435 family)
MLALLKDRFRLVYHTEQRPGPAYSVEPLKPKLVKADPNRRTSCRRNAVPSNMGAVEKVTCQNITMAQFAVWFSHYDGIGLMGSPPIVTDHTSLNGSWDFTVVYDGRVWLPEPEAVTTFTPGLPTAPEPDGEPNIFEAFQRQLGLRLVKTSAPVPVIVIDRLDRRPTEQ